MNNAEAGPGICRMRTPWTGVLRQIIHYSLDVNPTFAYRMMERSWHLKQKPPVAAVERLMAGVEGLHFITASLLHQRGITTTEEARLFLRPSADQLHSPYEMKGMDYAVDRLHRALNNGEPIMVLGDYDADGTTAAALFYSFLRQFSSHCFAYIPDRFKEGYGVSRQAIDAAAAKSAKLIVTLDCGIKSLDSIAYAAESKIDVIVCDHHLPGPALPLAHTILNPRQPGCQYPFKDLTGCAIGFKFCQAYLERYGPGTDMAMANLDLVAISTCADLVPMQGENRVFVSLGMEQIRRKPRLGIAALFREAKIFPLPDGRFPVDISTLSFVIAPRLNAAGRMDHGITAVELLSAYEERQARLLAARLEDSNRRRREADTSITQEALAMIEADPRLKNARSTVLYNQNWNRGVIGIAASRVMEYYYRPTVILTENQGKATGSARSVGEFDLYTTVEACSDLLDQWGGHTGAVGLTIDIENVDAFRERFEKEVRARLKPGQERPKLEADLMVDLNDISHVMLRQLLRVAPYGVQNSQPVFMATSLTVHGPIRVLNSKATGEPSHLSLVLQQLGSGATLQAIGFSLIHRLAEVESGRPLEAIFTVQENSMDGALRLMLKDIRAEAF